MSKFSLHKRREFRFCGMRARRETARRETLDLSRCFILRNDSPASRVKRICSLILNSYLQVKK